MEDASIKQTQIVTIDGDKARIEVIDQGAEETVVTSIEELKAGNLAETTFQVPECEKISDKDMQKVAKTVFIRG